jgi:hypothetical protein
MIELQSTRGDKVNLQKSFRKFSEIIFVNFHNKIQIRNKIPAASSRYMVEELLPCVSKIAALALAQGNGYRLNLVDLDYLQQSMRNFLFNFKLANRK